MELRPYQVESMEWLAFSAPGLSPMKHALLLDEPRVGKTAPALVAAVQAGAKKVAVLGPAIAREHWRRQAAMWAPDIEMMIDSVNRIATSTGVTEAFKEYRPDVLILDEAHLLRSPDAKRTKRIYGARCDGQGIAACAGAVWRLSGTLAPNHIGETWTHLRSTHQTTLDHMSFLYRFCHVYETQYGPMVGEPRAERIDEFKALLRPISLRRRRRDIWAHLPAAAWNTIPLRLSQSQERELRRLERELSVDTVKRSLAQARTPEEAERIIAEAEPHMASLRALVAKMKTPLVVEQIRELMDGGVEKLVVLGWHRQLIDDLTDKLQDYEAVKVYGATSEKDKWAAVDRFQTDADCRVLIGNIDTMGTCIALNAANHAFFAEYHWNLGSVIQAALRIVDVTRLDRPEIMVAVLADSLDEVIANRLVQKAEHADILNTLGEI